MAPPTVDFADAVSNSAGSLALSATADAGSLGKLRLALFSISNGTITTPSGWSLIGGTPIIFQTSRRIYLFSREHAGTSESTSQTFSFSAANNFSCLQYLIDNWDPLAFLNVSPIQVGSAASGTAMTAPAITPTKDDCLILRSFHMLLNASTVTMTDPTDTTRLDYQAGTGSAGHAVLGSRDNTSPAANVSAGTKASTSSAGGVWGATSIVIAPKPVDVQKLDIIRYRRSRPMFRR